MWFSEDNLPDFGSLQLDENGKDVQLLNEDVGKLDSLLTRAVCVGTYGVSRFPFESGSIAVVTDTQRWFMYNSYADTWYEWGT